jgi:DNA-directed RNA polymerase I and III subunit RPAC1
MKHFMKNLDINVLSSSDEEIVFDMAGIEAPLANALRRIMISEVATMAIDKVNLWQNTSIIPDEVLVHRIGLIPIKVDPSKFDYLPSGEEPSDKNSLKFNLNVKCTKKDITEE